MKCEVFCDVLKGAGAGTQGRGEGCGPHGQNSMNLSSLARGKVNHAACSCRGRSAFLPRP